MSDIEDYNSDNDSRSDNSDEELNVMLTELITDECGIELKQINEILEILLAHEIIEI